MTLFVGCLFGPACSTTSGADGPSCTNGTRDGDEVGVDCGGSCATKCTGEGCTTDGECGSGKCTNGACAAPVGKPCGVGTSVTTCNDGEPCELSDDCKSGSCEGAQCVPTKPGDTPPGPTDGKKNNGETDVDCGGPNAPKCDDGKTCAGDTDCATGYCDPANICKAPRYDDGVKNGDETDVDCGGTGAGMKKCAAGLACLVDGDCAGACNYEKKCVDEPSCKGHFGGDTCGPEEVTGATKQESCCRTLPVPGFSDASRPGKAVYLDKYEITAGRIRAWLASIPGQNVKAWIAANPPALWHASWTQFLPTGPTGDTIAVPRKPTNGTEQPPWNRNIGVDFQFNQQLFVYTHGHKCNNVATSYGMNTFFYSAAVQAANGSVARTDPFIDGGGKMPIQDALDMKSMTCVTSAMLQAFCAWDGGQLATDEVLDFVTGSPANSGSTATCGGAVGNRCAPLASINASSDSGNITPKNYSYPYFDAAGFDGTDTVMAPGRKMRGGPAAGQAIDTVVINAGDEPWMDLHGNMHEIALDTTNGAINPQVSGQGSFHVKFRGIGYSSARAGGNSVANNLSFPEYRAGYSTGRCMRFK
ncbi:MAG: hypothetical protein KF819_09370 [Labilithrix sp.]|nr:hypothetical protein [Labilithrix sp.]